MLIAPAGYGKTTLVVNWLAQTRVPHAWLSLDSYDDSLSGYLTYVLGAVRTLFPGACPETEAMLKRRWSTLTRALR